MTPDDYKAALAELMKDTWPYPGGEGYGIVYVGGGKYWPGIAAGCRLLRRLGCSWPVEVWYRGTCETVNRADVAGRDIEFIDHDAMATDRGDCRVPLGSVEVGGWQAKLYALTHTNFDRVIYLDADAYLVRKPGHVAELFSKAPFLYWSDLEELTANNVKWHAVWPQGPGASKPVQGGQLLIDRRGCWDSLVIAHWMCQYGIDYFFDHMFGDQDTWRVLMAAGKLKAHCLGPARWVHPAFVCDANSKPLVIHRCKGKSFAPEHVRHEDDAKPNLKLPLEAAYFHEWYSIMANREQPLLSQ